MILYIMTVSTSFEHIFINIVQNGQWDLVKYFGNMSVTAYPTSLDKVFIILQTIFPYPIFFENLCILIQILLKFVPMGPVNNEHWFR